MSHKNCPKRLKNRIFSLITFTFVLTFLFTFLLSDTTYAQTSDQISLQGKIVRNDTGYEGLNVVNGTPACVASGADTCDFQVKYYSASTSGTLYLTETFSDVEIGDYGGVFNLKLGSGSVTTSAECSDGTCNTIEEVFGEFKTIYLEIGFAPGGDGSFTETFTRTSLNASAFAMGAGSDSFSFYNTDDTGESSLNAVAGAVYYNTTDDELKVYNGSSWVSLGSEGATAWGIADVGTDYGAYMSATGIGAFDNFTLDTDDDRLSIHSDQMEGGLSVYSSYATTGGTWPLVAFKADSSNYEGAILELTQDGTGDILQGYSGSTFSFQIDSSGGMHLASNGIAYFEPFSSLPAGGDLGPNTGEGCLYSYGGSLYWDSDCSASSPTALGGGTTLWTDDGTFTYLTSTSDDLVLGASTTTNAPFFFDVSEKRLGIGTGSPQATIDIAGASSTISNTSGDITITPADNLVVADADINLSTNWSNIYGENLKIWGNNSSDIYLQPSGGNVGIGATSATATLHITGTADNEQLIVKANSTQTTNLTEWQNSSGTHLASIDPAGYAAFATGSANSSAILTLGANTSSVAQINFNASADIDVSSPNNGDLWWNGSNLYFYDGTQNIDLLSGGLGIYSEHGLVSDGSYLELVHSQNTHSVITNGWECVGGSNDEYCTGGYWRNVKDTFTNIKHSLSNVWNKADEDGVIRADVRLTNVELAPGVDVGTGGDGDITVSSDTNINTTSLISGRSCADGGDAVNYNISSFNVAGTEATLSTIPSTGCLSAGDEVLIINLQGTSTAYDNVGNYETLEVQSVSGDTVTFKTAKVKYYGNNTDDDSNLGTASGTQRVMLQRVPNYNNVTVNTSQNFYPSAWDGSKGGVLFFRASGDVNVNGTIHANNLGYRGGYGDEPDNDPGTSGGGIGDHFDVVGNSWFENGAGGGGGGGGGGGNGTDGVGSPIDTNNYGREVGYADLRKLIMGGGGGGGQDNDSGNNSSSQGKGGDGGGIIYIAGDAITVSGSLSSDGQDGTDPYNAGADYTDGAGGGGAGGSVFLQGNTLNVDGASVAGGNGEENTGALSGNQSGGDGADGRIAVYYSDSYTGSTSNPSTTNFYEVGYNYYGLYNSPVIPTLNSQSYGDIRWEESLDTYGKIGVQTRSGSSTDPTDGTWEEWKPSVDSTNYFTLENANTHTNWVGTNSTVAEGDVTRNVDYFEDEDEATATNLTKITSSTDGGYAEATISNSDISGYDYLTMWVRASETGNTLRLSMGESAGNEQTEDVTIDTTNTWQKVYWDISDITSTDIDAVTKLRVTNLTSASNTIYIDNIKAEKLCTDNSGCKISSTPDSYLQYRVVLTTTNLSYQPQLESIQFSYSTGYSIEIYDEDTVRLYNNTGASKYLKLDASTTAPETVEGQLDVIGDLNVTGVLELGTTGDMGTMQYDETNDQLQFTNDGSNWISMGEHTKEVTLSAEYPGAILAADGSDNTGSMASDAEGTSSNSMNYYEWSSSETTLQDYDVRVRFTLPSDFVSWDTDAVVFNYATETTSSSDNKADIYVYEESTATVDASFTDRVSATAGVWGSSTIPNTSLTDCDTAGETCVFILRMYSTNDNYTRIGDITLKYNREL
jgi:hypothetical protein